MKFPLSLPPPRRASRTWLPAIAAATLIGLLMLQLGWTRPIALPHDEPISPTRLDPIMIEPVVAAPVIVQRALFSRGRSPDAAAMAGTGPLDGAAVVGVAARGGRAVVFLQAPGGAVTALGPGAVYHGWTIVRVGTDGLTVRRGAETTILRVGPGPAATAALSSPAAQ